MRAPAPIAHPPLSATVLAARGARVTAAGTEWYWRVRRYLSRASSPQVAAFWATPAGAARRLVELLASGAGEPATEAAPRPTAPAAPTTIREAMGFWLGHQVERHEAKAIADATMTQARALARMIADAIGSRPVAHIGPQLLDDLALDLSAKFAPSSISVAVGAAIRALTWCMDRGLVPQQTLRMPRLRRTEDHPRTVARWRDFWAAEGATPLGPTWVMLCLVGLTGCRPIEAARARWADLSLSDDGSAPSTWRIGAHADTRNDGGKHPRTLALHPELAARLRRWRSHVGDAVPQATVTGQSPTAAKLWHLRVDWSALGLAEGLTGYDFRRLMSLTLMSQRVDPKVYEGLMGHSYEIGLRTYRQHDQLSQRSALVGAVEVIQQSDPAAARTGSPGALLAPGFGDRAPG